MRDNRIQSIFSRFRLIGQVFAHRIATKTIVDEPRLASDDLHRLIHQPPVITDLELMSLDHLSYGSYKALKEVCCHALVIPELMGREGDSLRSAIAKLSDTLYDDSIEFGYDLRRALEVIVCEMRREDK